MTTHLLADGLTQLAMIVIATAGLVGLLVGFTVAGGWLGDVRAAWTVRGACERIGHQAALGLRERLTGCEIAERVASRRT